MVTVANIRDVTILTTTRDLFPIFKLCKKLTSYLGKLRIFYQNNDFGYSDCKISEQKFIYRYFKF